ncbi:MAG: fasciclin domain-containing protein [Bacteroidetes bacterium]|nr:fasciclin domain-containing protein [Bacteroidota bacterium]MBU1372527.1 fasciclin domain-containing protein [Bacteroidota bacterium]MBU1485064.1 fasciclin domain-containing protein [Bacteroidota bacterium]MBU1761733.1 fasciclin domain-containing protein [Bacteroidota bacterium]MBU2268406.1 fasciclin domain-containing protein [Bacteroidota bacterium]
MKKNFIKILMLVSVIGLSITACNSNKTADANSDSSAMDSMSMDSSMQEGVMVGGAMMVPSKNIVENAVGSSDHTTLVAAVKAAGLVETLSGTGPFTVFAPTNEAFAALPAGTVDNLLKPEMKGDLTKVLTYHVVAGALKASDLTDGMELTTVEGAKLKVTVKDGVVMVGDAKVTIADIISSNGVTHVIDKVLLPPPASK